MKGTVKTGQPNVKYKIRPLFYAIYNHQLKVDYRLEYKTQNCKRTRKKHGE